MATAMPKTSTVSAPKSDEEMTDIYLQITRMIERLHRRHLDMLRYELDRLGIDGISAAQALMMTKIKGQTISVRDLVERGYYLGSNASYNIKQLVNSGFVLQERSPHDRRSMRLKLTEEGEELCRQIAAAEASYAKSLAEETDDMSEIAGASHVLRNLENTWSNYLRYGDH
jgi:DNA-binding MarR family transcriptional regulator